MDVRCASEALAELEKAARDGLLALPRIGLSVGGLLIGKRERQSILVRKSVEIPCSYAMGPSFTLLPEELEAARDLRRRVAGDLENVLVGWYRSKTSGPLVLTDQDRALFGALCPESWQVAMLIQPLKAAPTRAVFGFRSAGASGFQLGVPAEMPLPETDASLLVEPQDKQSALAAEAPPVAAVAVAAGSSASAPVAAVECPKAPTESVAPVSVPPPARPTAVYTGTLFVPPEPKRPGKGEGKAKKRPRGLSIALVGLAALGIAAFVTACLTGNLRMLFP